MDEKKMIHDLANAAQTGEGQLRILQAELESFTGTGDKQGLLNRVQKILAAQRKASDIIRDFMAMKSGLQARNNVQQLVPSPHHNTNKIDATSKLTGTGSPTKKRILIVDDDINFLEVEKTFLSMQNFELIAISDATVAAKWIEANSVDAVISDMQMPHITGPELFRRIMTVYLNKPLPVLVLLTGAMEAGPEVQKWFDSGIVHRFMKPADINEIARYLNRHLSKVVEIELKLGGRM